MLPLVRKHTDALLAGLAGLGLLVGDARAPDAGGRDDGSGTFTPYVVLYPPTVLKLPGTLDRPDDDAWMVFPITSVAESRSQAEWLDDRALSIRDAGLTVPDRHVAYIGLDVRVQVRRDDSTTPPLFVAHSRLRVDTTPRKDEEEEE